MLGNIMHVEFYITGAEIDFFKDFKHRYSYSQQQEQQRGIIYLNTPGRGNKRPYRARKNQSSIRRPVGKPTDWHKLRSIRGLLGARPNLFYLDIARLVPCSVATIWKVKKMLRSGAFKEALRIS